MACAPTMPVTLRIPACRIPCWPVLYLTRPGYFSRVDFLGQRATTAVCRHRLRFVLRATCRAALTRLKHYLRFPLLRTQQHAHCKLPQPCTRPCARTTTLADVPCPVLVAAHPLSPGYRLRLVLMDDGLYDSSLVVTTLPGNNATGYCTLDCLA